MFLDAACKHKQVAVSDANHIDSAKILIVDTVQKENLPPPAGNTVGKVSHQFASKGCATVIVVIADGGGEELVLIPHIPLENKFDREGSEIYFNYRPLKMPQPPGCEKGIPAEITDISFK